ncbi:MAG: nitrate- and nitrite sensing domain-containing protein [Pseudomonadota bacterium]
MLLFLNRFSIRNRLLVIVGAASIVLLCLSVPQLTDSFSRRQSSSATLEAVNLASTASALVHELQRERGNSAGVISSNGDIAFRQQLAEQRARTDKALNVFRTALGVDAASTSGTAEALAKVDRIALSVAEKIKEIATVRSSVDNLAFSSSRMSAFYTGLVTELLSLFSETLLSSPNASIVSDGTALIALLEAKERAGRERSLGTQGFNQDVFSLEIAVKQRQLVAEQTAFFHGFKAAAPSRFNDSLQTFAKSDASKQVNELRDAGYESATNASVSRVKATQWFAAATERIDALFEIEKALAQFLVQTAADAKAQALTSIIMLSSAVLFCVGALAALGVLLGESIRRPVTEFMNMTSAMRDGRYDNHFPYQESDSEIGKFARNLTALQQGLVETDELRKEQEAARELRIQEEQALSEERKQKELEERVRAEKAAAEQQNAISKSLQELADVVKDELAQMIDGLAATAKQARGSSASLIACTERVTSDVTSASDASEAAAQSSQSIAAAAEEMNVSLSDVTDQVAATRELIRETSSEATTVSDSLSGLTTAANKIADMVTIIADIADQTNLLALNATIEAARAGEAGKGFAVVASEVKSLANQTSRSLEEIQSGVDVMQNEVQGAVSRVQNIASQITELTDRSDSVSDAVSEQSNVTREIAQAIQSAFDNVTKAAGQIDSVAKENTAMVESSSDISGLTNKIEEGVSDLQTRLMAVIAETNAKSERRRAERLEPQTGTSLSFTTEAGEDFSVALQDLSKTGMSIDMTGKAASFKVGEIIQAHWHDERFDCLVIWMKDNIAGLSFLDKLGVEPMVNQLLSGAQPKADLAKAS